MSTIERTYKCRDGHRTFKQVDADDPPAIIECPHAGPELTEQCGLPASLVYGDGEQ